MDVPALLTGIGEFCAPAGVVLAGWFARPSRRPAHKASRRRAVEEQQRARAEVFASLDAARAEADRAHAEAEAQRRRAEACEARERRPPSRKRAPR